MTTRKSAARKPASQAKVSAPKATAVSKAKVEAPVAEPVSEADVQNPRVLNTPDANYPTPGPLDAAPIQVGSVTPNDHPET